MRVDNGPIIPRVSFTMHGGPGTEDPGRIYFKQISLEALTARACRVSHDQIRGPSWFDDPHGERFTITATMPPDTNREQFQAMLRNLLAKRFHLVVHSHVMNAPGYVLVVAAGGSRLQKWNPGLAPTTVEAVSGARDEEGFPRLAPNKAGAANIITMKKTEIAFHSTHRQSMADFADRLGFSLNASDGSPTGAVHPGVVDRTGLAGIYEFRILLFAPRPMRSPSGDTVAQAGAVPVRCSRSFRSCNNRRTIKRRHAAARKGVVDPFPGVLEPPKNTVTTIFRNRHPVFNNLQTPPVVFARDGITV
jgi:uncharacterized protein (TIGR03435 family)